MFGRRKPEPPVTAPPPPPPVGSVQYARTGSFEEAQALCIANYTNDAVLADLETSWFYNGEPRLTDLPDFFGPFFAMMAVAERAIANRPIRVLDFGGTTGRYADYARAMFPGIVLEWIVVETPVYLDYAKRKNLSGCFVPSMDAITEPVDVAVFSGVLQYLPDWQAVLCHPQVQGATVFFLTRTPIAENETAFVQRVIYASGPMQLAARMLPETQLFGLIGKSHRLHASWALEHHLGELGVARAPSMIWLR